MRRGLVAGNWKMHGSRKLVSDLLQTVAVELEALTDAVDVVICPPATLLPVSEHLLPGTGLILGAQNVYSEHSGAFTGEISAAMLAECSVRYVIIGHSERRRLFAESDAAVAAKFRALQECSLIPILCLGETLEERQAGRTREVVTGQLEAVLQDVGVRAFDEAVIAYEPVWAIGSGQTATPEQAQEVHGFIRELVAGEDGRIAQDLRIVYGGSVKAASASLLFEQPDIDGGLIGGASLDAQEFIKICKSVS